MDNITLIYLLAVFVYIASKLTDGRECNFIQRCTTFSYDTYSSFFSSIIIVPF